LNCYRNFYLNLDETTDNTGQNNRTRPVSSLLGRQKSSSILTISTRRKREQQNENLQNAIAELLNHFSHRNLDAIVRVIRITLEKLKKRITLSYNYSTKINSLKPFFFFIKYLFSGRNRREAPVFKVFAQLAIPNVTIQPTIDEVQIYLNKVVQTIISISKNISQWDKDRSQKRVNKPEPPPPLVDVQTSEHDRYHPIERDDDGNNLESSTKDLVPQIIQQPKVQFTLTNNFFKNVSDNKDISKLISQLATCINATKKV